MSRTQQAFRKYLDIQDTAKYWLLEHVCQENNVPDGYFAVVNLTKPPRRLLLPLHQGRIPDMEIVNQMINEKLKCSSPA